MTYLDYVDLYSGPGGWDVAAERLGLRGTGIELDPAACETRKAAGLLTLEGSVTSPALQMSHLVYAVPGLIASPPCQAFSSAGKGEGRAELPMILEALKRWAWDPSQFHTKGAILVLEPARWILERMASERPYRWIAMEQVPTCLSIWEAYAEMLEALGYFTAVGVLSSEQFGVPQTRKRAILIAHRERPVSLPTPTHSKYNPRYPDFLQPGLLPWVSMAEGLGWTEDAEVVSNYGTGGDPKNRGVRTGAQPAAAVTGKIGRNIVRRRNGAQKNATVRDIDSPAPTILGSADNGDTRWVGPDDSWRITVHEAGILQSFDADYPWRGNKTQQYQQVGNAIPVLLAEAVLRQVIDL